MNKEFFHHLRLIEPLNPRKHSPIEGLLYKGNIERFQVENFKSYFNLLQKCFRILTILIVGFSFG